MDASIFVSMRVSQSFACYAPGRVCNFDLNDYWSIQIMDGTESVLREVENEPESVFFVLYSRIDIVVNCVFAIILGPVQRFALSGQPL